MPDYRQATLLAVIAVAVLVFSYEQTRDLELAYDYGAVPQDLCTAASKLLSGQINPEVLGVLLTSVTSIFLHGDAQHLLFNMIYLWAFGSLVVRHLGQWMMLLLFLVTGIFGDATQTWLEPNSPNPIIGASGAICGLEGIYLGLAMRWTLRWPDVWPLAHPIPPLQLGAFAILGAGYDIYSLMNQQQGIAFGAHLGGFLSGLALAGVITQIFATENLYSSSGSKL